jgi:hypothetical protein
MSLRPARLLVLSIALLVVPCGTAGAATLTRSGSVVTYTASAGVSNNVQISTGNSSAITFDDFGSGETVPAAVTGCTTSGPAPVLITCTGIAGLSVVFNLGDLGDSLSPSGSYSTPVTINGGPGDEQALTGGSGADTINAGPGNDGSVGGTGISGGDGADTIDLGPGDDAYVAATDPGSDTVTGGTGDDILAAGNVFPTGATISLDGVANDVEPGDPGINNFGADFETVLGSTLDDTLTGSASDNVIDGQGGNDTINGVGGNDQLLGGPGDDALNGGDGNDTLLGDTTLNPSPGQLISGNDTLVGGNGDDELKGGSGADVFEGDAGNDTADFSDRFGVSVTLDDVANDGPPSDGDNVKSDVENVIGSPGPDNITGSSAANVVLAGDGADTIDLHGDSARDVVNCGDGVDTFFIDANDAADPTSCEGAVGSSGSGSQVPVGGPGGGSTTGGGTTGGGGTNTTTTVVQQVPAAPDTKKASLLVSGVPTKLSLRTFLARGIAATVLANEPVRYGASLTAKTKVATIASVGQLSLAESSTGLVTAVRKITLKPSKKVVGKAKAFTVVLTITATDRGGNVTTFTKKIAVK